MMKSMETTSRTAASLAALKNGTPDGAPKIGGPFTLVDENGKTVTDESLKGHYTLVFFGFTNCEDECPQAMSLIAEAYGKLSAAQQAKLQVVMITVDPKRDTPTVVGNYAKHFNPAFHGYTGTDAQIEQAAAHYLAYHAIKNAASAKSQVAHSSFIYFMDTNGKYLRHFPYNEKLDTLTATLQAGIK